MYQSEVVQNSLDPTFKMVELDICKLTEGSLEGPVRITLHEKDDGDAKDYLGQIVTSVKDIIWKPHPLTQWICKREVALCRSKAIITPAHSF